MFGLDDFEPSRAHIVLLWSVLSIWFVIIATLCAGWLAATVIEIIPDDVRRFKAWLRKQRQTAANT